jgi:hypothetical protein
MSLQALPTELDEQIIGHLVQTDLSTMSRVSKYHRKMAEPLLYRAIALWDDRGINIRSLLLTLLSRSDLALHVRRLLVRQDLRSSRSRQLTSEVDNRMEEALPAIHNSIKTIIGTDAGTAGIRAAWLGSILSEDFVGGTTALVACLSHNVESVSFVCTTSDGCSTFSRMLFEAASASSQHSGHLSKLTSLGFVDRKSIYVPNLPSLQDLRILGSQNVIFPQDSALTKVGSLLWAEASKLPSLATFIHQNGLPHLQRLFIHGRRSSPAEGLQAVIDELSVGCPELTTLTLAADFQHETPLSRLTALRNVHDLNIDVRFLLLQNNQDQLLNSGGLLPPKLTTLQIRGVAYADIGRLMLENNSQEPLTLRPFFPYGPSLKAFFFHVRDTNVQREGYDTLLASIAKMLHAQGVEFKVYRYPIVANNERGPQLLITHADPVTQ